MSGKYIYGIINSGEQILRNNDEFGIYTIPFQDVSAVVSDSEITDYTHIPANMAAQHLVRHQIVIERVMKDFNIIPMRLDTVLLSADEVAQALEKGKELIKEIFSKIKNRIEMDVTAAWSDINSVIREVAEEEEIKTFRQALAGKKEGITTDEQIKMGFFIKNYLSIRKNEYAEVILDSLKTIADSQKNYDCPDDAMIVNAAFLLNRDAQQGFEIKLDELNDSFEERVKFRCVGPLPVYSFYSLEVKKMKYEDITWAAQKLELSGFTTKDDIKKAYKNSAFMCHPDRQPDTKKAVLEYNEITKAYRLLSEYCEKNYCNLNEDEVIGNVITLKLRG